MSKRPRCGTRIPERKDRGRAIEAKNDLLRQELHRGHITQDQYHAGRSWQQDYQTAEFGAYRNVLKVRVDCSSRSAGECSENARLDARENYFRALPFLGRAGFALLVQILGQGASFLDIVMQEKGDTAPDSADRKYVGRRFRELLDALVTKGSAKSPVSYLFPGRALNKQRVKEIVTTLKKQEEEKLERWKKDLETRNEILRNAEDKRFDNLQRGAA